MVLLLLPLSSNFHSRIHTNILHYAAVFIPGHTLISSTIPQFFFIPGQTLISSTKCRPNEFSYTLLTGIHPHLNQPHKNAIKTSLLLFVIESYCTIAKEINRMPIRLIGKLCYKLLKEIPNHFQISLVSETTRSFEL